MSKEELWKKKDFRNDIYKNYLEMDKFIKGLNLSEDTTFYLDSYGDNCWIEVNYKILESDEEYNQRIKAENLLKKENEKSLYEQYLKLKAKFEGENNNG